MGTGGLQRLTLESIANIDNRRIGVAFQQALHRCVADCNDRPALESARKVTLTVTLKPEADELGAIMKVATSFQIKDALPARSSADYEMAGTSGGLLFRELSPSDVDQATFEFTHPREVDLGEDDQEKPSAEKASG